MSEASGIESNAGLALQVLLVEDDRTDAMLHERYLRKAGEVVHRVVAVTHAASLKAALAALDALHAFDVVVLDLNLPDCRGLDCVRELRNWHPDVALVILTGDDDVAQAVRAVGEGAHDYLIKGRISPDVLGRSLMYAGLRLSSEQALRQSREEHRALFEGNPVPVLVYDRETLRFLAVNRAAARQYGWSRDEFRAIGLPDLWPPDEPREPQDAREAVGGVFRHRMRNGEVRHMKISAHLLTFRGRSACLLLCDDVTVHQATLDALQRSERRFRDLFEQSLGLICEHDLDGVIAALNPAAAAALGRRVEDVAGRRLHDIVPPPFRAHVDLYLATIAREGHYEGLMTVVRADGKWRAWRCRNRLQRDEAGRALVVGHAQDVTEEMQREEELRDQSLTDPLTGARNRRYLDWLAASGHLDNWGCLVVDIDRFKQINDTQGHARGDEILRTVATFLTEHVRQQDVVVRTGGDEFLVLLANDSAPQTATMAERLQREAVALPCAVTIGAARREGNEPLKETLARADAALYASRARSRGS